MRVFLFVLFLSISNLAAVSAGSSSPGLESPKTESLLSILCYHNIDLSSPKDSPYSVTSSTFAAELTALRNAGFEFVSLGQVEDFYASGKPLPPRSVLITFDDGHENIYTRAYPLLKRMGIPWALFIFPTAIGRGHERGFMDWNEVRTLHGEGVAIGSHSFDHPFLTKPEAGVATREAYDRWLDKELKYSKKLIETQLGTKVTSFASPFGALNDVIQQHIGNSGYSLAFNVFGSNNDRASDPLQLNRIIVLAKDTPETIVKKAQERPLHFRNTIPGSLRVFTGLFGSIAFSLDDIAELAPGSVHALLNGKKIDALEENGSVFSASIPAPTSSKNYVVTVYATRKTGESCSQSYAFTYAEKFPAFLQPSLGKL